MSEEVLKRANSMEEICKLIAQKEGFGKEFLSSIVYFLHVSTQ
jgi:hypothetical protein